MPQVPETAGDVVSLADHEAAPDQIEEAIEAMEPKSSLRDDMLRLIFTCCHPALGREAQVALSLRTLARLEVPAIARAFLVPEATMAQAPGTGPRQDRHGPHPLRDPRRHRASRPAGRGAGGGVPGRHRGPRPGRRACGGPGRSRGRGDPAGPLAGRPDARRARGALPACLAAADLGPHLCPHRRRRSPGDPGRPGPHPLEPSRDHRGFGVAVRGGGPVRRNRRALSAPGSPRRGPLDRCQLAGHGLGPDRRRSTGRSRLPSATAPSRGWLP